MTRKIHLKIKRQNSPKSQSYWHEFEVLFQERMTVISALYAIQKKPITINGEAVAPVVWQSSCLQGGCGSCVMLVNGKAKQACETFLEDLTQPIIIEPLSQFPIVRDLRVDRSKMSQHLKERKVFIEDISYKDDFEVKSLLPKEQKLVHHLSACTSCGACLEVCPQYQKKSQYIGAATIVQSHTVSLHHIGKLNRKEKLNELIKNHGIDGCNNAQNCVKSCPQDIYITDLLAQVKKDTTLQFVKNIFGGKF